MSRHSARLRQQSGMALLELVVAMGMISMITLLGLQAVRIGLEGLVREGKYQSDFLKILELRESILAAWDSRCAHALQPGPWLVLEGKRAGQAFLLTRLKIRIVTTTGDIADWQLERVGSAWQVDGQAIAFDGEIRVWPGPVVCQAGNPAPVLHFQFPGVSRSDLRQGFALVALW